MGLRPLIHEVCDQGRWVTVRQNWRELLNFREHNLTEAHLAPKVHEKKNVSIVYPSQPDDFRQAYRAVSSGRQFHEPSRLFTAKSTPSKCRLARSISDIDVNP